MDKLWIDWDKHAVYAIIDLPYDICVQRTHELYDHQACALVDAVNASRLHVVFDFDDPDYLDVDGVIMLTRWQGTQTRLALQITSEQEYDDIGEFWDNFLVGLYLVGTFFVVAMLTRNSDLSIELVVLFALGGLMLKAFLSRLDLQIYRYPLLDIFEYLDSEWNTLLSILSGDDAGDTLYLVEQGTPKTLYHEDHAAQMQSGQQNK